MKFENLDGTSTTNAAPNFDGMYHINIVDAPTDSLGNPVGQNIPTGILNTVDFNNQKLKELFETIGAIESKITPESVFCDECPEHIPVNSLLGAVSLQEIIIKNILTIANHIYEML